MVLALQFDFKALLTVISRVSQIKIRNVKTSAYKCIRIFSQIIKARKLLFILQSITFYGVWKLCNVENVLAPLEAYQLVNDVTNGYTDNFLISKKKQRFNKDIWVTVWKVVDIKSHAMFCLPHDIKPLIWIVQCWFKFFLGYALPTSPLLLY